jgi:hypothetical protein
MANPGIGGISAPDAEDGNQLDLEQQNEEERRRRDAARLNAGQSSHDASQHSKRPHRSSAFTPEKSEAPPRAWQDTLAESLTKLNDEQRHRYDALISNANERNGTVSPTYHLGVASLLAKNLTGTAFGKDFSDLNHKEDARSSRLQHAPEKPAVDRQPADPIRASSIGRVDSPAVQTTVQTVVQRQADAPPPAAPPPQKSPPADRTGRNDAEVGRQLSPRKAAPDRTRLVNKRFQNMLGQHAERRRALKLPSSRAEQNEFARLDSSQEAARKAILERRSAELKLLTYQHAAERTGMAAEWLARDLKNQGSAQGAADAAIYDKESRQAYHVAQQAHERRQALVWKSAHPRGWEDAASASTDTRPSARQDDQRTVEPQSAPTGARQGTVAPPLNEDPTAHFKDKSGAVLTEDRLRTMLGRYEEIREIRFMPSGLSENDHRSRLDNAHATVRKNLQEQQQKMSRLLDHQHQAERVGASATWLAKDTHQLRYRAEARRAYSVARFAMERSHAVDPRSRGMDDPMNDQVRAANEQSDRQSALQEAAKGGRTLSSEERANLPASAASAVRDRSTRSSERSGRAGQDRGEKPGPTPSRGGNARGG